MSKLVLFDLDRTLVDVSMIHGPSYREMFKSLHSIDATYTDLPIERYCGNTTKGIIREILKKHGFEEDYIEDNLKCSMHALNESFIWHLLDARNVGEDDFVYESSEVVLDNLVSLGGRVPLHLGLYTGGPRQTTEAVLNFTKLRRYFQVLAFGDSPGVENRTDLMKLALESCSDFYGVEFDDVIVFGDSIHDVRSAKELGFNSVALSTGAHTYEMLEAENSDFLFTDLSEAKNILEKILDINK